MMQMRIEKRFPPLECAVSNNPVDALAMPLDDFALILVDLDMPEMDGAEFLSSACGRGHVDRCRVIVHSSHDAADLHDRFDMGQCLAVINKLDPDQQAALDLILADLAKKDRSP